MSLPRTPDSNAVAGWAWAVKLAYGSSIPLKFRGISYAGKTPANDTGLTFQLLVKAARTDADAAALVNNSTPTVSTDPLEVGFTVDSTIAGFAAGGTYYGELWLTDSDASYGRQLVNEFQIELTDPIKNSFA